MTRRFPLGLSQILRKNSIVCMYNFLNNIIIIEKIHIIFPSKNCMGREISPLPIFLLKYNILLCKDHCWEIKPNG